LPPIVCRSNGEPSATFVDPEPTRPPVASGWNTLADLPQERTELSAVALAGQVYVAGGITADARLPTELFIYDSTTDEWREGAPIPDGRHHAPLAAHDGTVYLVGGFIGGIGPSMEPTDTMLLYDVDTDSWQDGPPPPANLSVDKPRVGPEI
jgi:hypothetical protein